MSIQRSVLERLRKGDEQAFEVVYHAFHRRIYGFLLSSLGERRKCGRRFASVFFPTFMGSQVEYRRGQGFYGLPFYNSSQSGV